MEITSRRAVLRSLTLSLEDVALVAALPAGVVEAEEGGVDAYPRAPLVHLVRVVGTHTGDQRYCRRREERVPSETPLQCC